MIQRILLTMMLATMASVGLAKKKGYVPVYSSGYMNVQIVDVVRSDTATIVALRCSENPGDELWFRDWSFYLSDEQLMRYPLRYAKGIKLDQMNLMPISGDLDFTLIFEPLPVNVKFFDLLTNNRKFPPFAFWGIHRDGQKVPKSGFGFTTNINDRICLQDGNAVICGKIEGYEWTGKEDSLTIYAHPYHKVRKNWSANYVAKLDSCGRFQFDFPVENTSWVYLEGMNLYIPVVVNPNDTLNITINNMDHYDMQVSYVSTRGFDVMEKLMKAAPSTQDHVWKMSRSKTIRPDNLHKEVTLRKRLNRDLCNYLVWKYGLSDVESHLILLELDSHVYEVAIQRLDWNFHETYMHEEGNYAMEWLDSLLVQPVIMNEYGFFSEIDINDYGYFVLPGQYIINRISRMNPISLSAFGGREKKKDMIKKYLKQEVCEELDKRLFF